MSVGSILDWTKSSLFPSFGIRQAPRRIQAADEIRLAGLTFELNGGVIDIESITEESVDLIQNLGTSAGHLILNEDMGAQRIDPRSDGPQVNVV